MQLQIDISEARSAMFLKLLEVYKMDNIVTKYTVVSKSSLDVETAEILEEISMLSATLNDAEHGLGEHTGKYVEIKNI